MTDLAHRTDPPAAALSSLRFSARSFHIAVQLAQVLAILTFLLGLGVLVGWAFDVATLKSVAPRLCQHEG